VLIALLVAAAVHLGFQLTITVVAYPALLATPDSEWRAAHAAHGRRITPLVAVVYGALVVTAVGALLTDPSPAVVVAASACAVAALSTAAVAAPTHGRLGDGRTAELVRRLTVADVVRTAAAVVAVVAAAVAVA
jgi:sugar phosphate isomerase/epimerase